SAGNSGVFDTNGSDTTLSGQLTGAGFTKIGLGTLRLTSTSLPGTPMQSTARVNVNAGTLSLAAVDSANVNLAPTASAGINVNTGGTLLLDNIRVGQVVNAFPNGTQPGFVDLLDG